MGDGSGRLAVVALALALGLAPVEVLGAQSAGTVMGRNVRVDVRDGVQQGQEGWLGIGISCDQCSLRRSRSEPGRWTFREPPAVFFVDQDGPAYRAGLRRGDTLLTIDGQDLTSDEGGRAFARVAPDQRIRITYRRDGREREARITATERPQSEAATAAVERLRAVQESQQQEMERARAQMRQAARELARLNQLMRLNDSAAAQDARHRLQEAESTLAALSVARAFAYPPRAAGVKYFRGIAAAPPAPPAAPTAPVSPVPPAAPAAPVAPALPAPPEPPTPPPYTVFRGFGGLRYSGRLGDAIVEARARGPVSTQEVGDSEVIVSAGDLSVRVALRPRASGTGFSFAFATATPVASGTASTAEGDMVYGVSTYPVNTGLGRTFGVTAGLLVLDVAPHSHADSLGIEAGDVLLEANGHAVFPAGARPSPGARRAPGRAAPRAGAPGAQSATVMRAGERRTLRIPGTAASPPSTPRPQRP